MLLKIYRELPKPRHLARIQCRTITDIPTVPRRVIFSGIQPTGIPHLGNYLGALKQWVNLQKEPGDIYYSIVDLHALTVHREERIIDKVLEMTACLLACGIDPQRSILFRHSDIMEHAMLSWTLGCQISLNRLKGLSQWKEKASKYQNTKNSGLLTYPVLQSADILLYKTTNIPVGEDQNQNVELCRDVAGSFNNTYGNYFPIPQKISDPGCARIRSLRDPFSKMSKSEVTGLGKINLDDSDEDILMKMKKAVTDSTSAVTYDPIRRPGVSNLIQIHSSVTGIPINDICERSNEEGWDTGQYKMVVAEAVLELVRPIRTEYEKYLNDKEYLASVLAEGAVKAKEVAEINWEEISKLIGIR